jgi:hypothetical protein
VFFGQLAVDHANQAGHLAVVGGHPCFEGFDLVDWITTSVGNKKHVRSIA